MANILRNTLDDSIEVVTDLPVSVATTRGNPGQIQQALLNICLNARDAMPDGGKLCIALRESTFPGKSENFLCLSVSDTGTGIPAELQSRIFDPFFTTKGLAKNMGLGLSSAYATVKMHSGFIDVQSSTGKGSTFRIFIPIVDKPPKPEQETDIPKTTNAPPWTENQVAKGIESGIEEVPTGRKTILIIDDEIPLLNSISLVLKQAGYDVLCASDGKSGLEIIRKSFLGDKGAKNNDTVPMIDLVILDLLLPDMSGEQVLEDIRAVTKRMPVIIITGCHAKKRLMDLLDMEIETVIMKPFDDQALIREVVNFLG